MSRFSRAPALFALAAIVLALGVSSTVLAQAPVTFTLGPGRDAVQPGTITMTPRGAQTEIVVQAQSGGAGVQQPAHVHEGSCPGVGPVRHPLTNVVDGRSTTTVNASLDDLLSGAYSINLHRSTAEAQIYTACINLTRAGGAAPSGGAAPATTPPRTGTAGAAITGTVPMALLTIGAGVILLSAIGLAFRRSR
jgi:hypothetical protein